MIYPELAAELLELKKTDLRVRQRLIKEGKLFNGYNSEMEKVHIDNAARLTEIISLVGYPTTAKVGLEASQAAWLVIQHAISLPKFMKDCLFLARQEVINETIDPVAVAFLEDRIAMFEGKPQPYGSQFIGDLHGDLVVYQIDGDEQTVNERRKSLGLGTIAERLDELKSQMQKDRPPHTNTEQIKEEKEGYDRWRRQVGWIK